MLASQFIIKYNFRQKPNEENVSSRAVMLMGSDLGVEYTSDMGAPCR